MGLWPRVLITDISLPDTFKPPTCIEGFAYRVHYHTLEGTEVRVANFSGRPVLLRSRKGTNFDLCLVTLTNRTECSSASPFSTVDTPLPPSSPPSLSSSKARPLGVRWCVLSRLAVDEEEEDVEGEREEEECLFCRRSLVQLACVMCRM